MSDSLLKAIGGYFELELPPQRQHLYPNLLRFQSARAAFYALLMTGRPNRVWMPKYICDSMLAPLKVTDTKIVFYDLDSALGVSSDVQIEDGDWLLYVNYFGVCAAQEDRLLKRFNANQLIFDHAQAFFAPPRECLATIYSPRKFLGVPDGGLLFTSLPVTESLEIDTDSVARCVHLLKRLDSTPETGYQYFKNAEETFCDMQPRRMSTLTARLLNSVDYPTARERRNANFRLLHEQLNHLNGLSFGESRIDGPLCYPLLVGEPSVRERLLANRVFVATYWPEVRGRVSDTAFESRLVNECLPIPCDQRYASMEMRRIIDLLFGGGL